MFSQLKLLSILLIYYPIHPTAYIFFKYLLPGVPPQLFSAWQDVLIFTLFIIAFRSSLHKISLKPIPIDFVIGLLIALSLPSAINSGIFSYNTINGFRIMYMPMLLYFSIRLVPKDFDQYLRLIHLILSISSVVAIIGILFYYFVPIEIMNIWYASNEFTIGYYQNIRRMDSIFWSPVVFGSLMAASSILCYSLTFGSNNDKYRSAYYIGIVLFTYCCVLSLSRGSWVNLLIGLSTIMLIKIRTNPGFIGFLLIVIISAMIGVYGASNSEDPWVKHIATIFSSNKELGSGEINRQEQREAGWDDIRKNIVFGRGLGKSGYIAGRDSENNEVDYAVTADNWYLKYFQESGIVGFIVFIYFIVYFIIYMLKSYVNTKQVQHKSLVLGICACFIGFSFQAYGSNAWDFPMLNSILWVLIGVGVNISQTCSKSYIRRRTSCNQTHKRSILKGAGNEQVNL